MSASAVCLPGSRVFVVLLPSMTHIAAASRSAHAMSRKRDECVYVWPAALSRCCDTTVAPSWGVRTGAWRTRVHASAWSTVWCMQPTHKLGITLTPGPSLSSCESMKHGYRTTATIMSWSRASRCAMEHAASSFARRLHTNHQSPIHAAILSCVARVVAVQFAPVPLTKA